MPEKHKFKPGDKVRIISAEAPVVEAKGFEDLIQELHVNDIVTIDEYHEKGNCYTIKEDDGFFIWMACWLGPCTSKLEEFINSLSEEQHEKQNNV